MNKNTIRLRDDEVNLMDYKIGDTCQVEIKGILKGIKEEQDYSTDNPIPLGSKDKLKPPKKYIEYTVEIQKVKEEKPKEEEGKGKEDFFGEDKKTGKYFTK